MKNGYKIITVILCFCLCFCACGKSEEDILVENIVTAFENSDFEGFFELCEQAKLYELNEEQTATIETYKATVFNLSYEMIKEDITNAKMEKAFKLCEKVLLMDFKDEQLEQINVLKTAIEDMCFAGTFIVEPDYLSDIEALFIVSFQNYNDLVNDKSNVEYAIKYYKRSECEVAAQEYKDYLDQNLIYLGVEVDDGTTYYEYADEEGRLVNLSLCDPELGGISTCLFIEVDYDLFDISRMKIDDIYATIEA